MIAQSGRAQQTAPSEQRQIDALTRQLEAVQTQLKALAEQNRLLLERQQEIESTLAKGVPELAGFSLLRQSRLSVCPVTDAEWTTICKMAETAP